MRRAVQLLVLALLASADSWAQAQTVTAPELPVVLVVATGGTIAGVQPEPGSFGPYEAGTLTAEQILASVPQLNTIARVAQHLTPQKARILLMLALARTRDRAEVQRVFNSY